MADINELSSSGSVKIAGASTSGAETGFIGNTLDRLNVISTFDKNSITTDSTGVLRVNSTKQIFGYYFNQTLHPLSMRNKVENGATLTLDTAASSAVLTATPTSGSRAQFESKFVTRYTLGRSHFTTLSVTPGTGQVGYTKLWGYFSDTNGYFFKHVGGESEIRLGFRTNSTGVTGIDIPQSQWNLDKCDGTGKSGFNLNRAKSAVYIIEYTWHGNGVVRWGIQYNKDIIFVHEILADNTSDNTLTRNPSQPVKFECFRDGNGTPVTEEIFKIHALSANVIYSGPLEATYKFSTSRGVSPVTIQSNIYKPLISIRPSLLFNGRINRSLIAPTYVRFYAQASPLHIQIVENATLTGASWGSAAFASSVERDISATAFTGGNVIFEDYIGQDVAQEFDLARNSSPEIESFVLGLSVDGTVADSLTVVARSLTNNSDGYASIYWGEYQ